MRTFTSPAVLLALVSGLAACAAPPPASPPGPPPVATFSIVARDPATGDFGVAVQSRFLGVGAVVPWAKAGVGAVATQAWANTTFGPRGLDLMALGAPAGEALSILVAGDPGRDFRQVGIVDAEGRAAAHTGGEALDYAGHFVGDGYACQGNILAGEPVVKAMAKAYEAGADLDFPERLVAALAAGQEAGGDKRGMQSAALLVVREGGGYSGFDDRMIDLRVEDHERPIAELSRLLALHRRTFGRPPAPREREGFEMEAAPADPGSLATPRAAYETWVDRLRREDYEGAYAVQSLGYRKEKSLDAFREELTSRRAELLRFVDRAVYAGTRIEGDRARVALRMPASPRPVLLEFVREEGEWRSPD